MRGEDREEKKKGRREKGEERRVCVYVHACVCIHECVYLYACDLWTLGSHRQTVGIKGLSDMRACRQHRAETHHTVQQAIHTFNLCVCVFVLEFVCVHVLYACTASQ